jgi:hypothetical protein
MKANEENPKVRGVLEEILPYPPRGTASAARRRSEFLKQASILHSNAATRSSSSVTKMDRPFFPLFSRKERTPMWNTVFAVVLAVVLCFGGTGATVAAAQASLPGQVLYPVKTWTEDAALSLANSAQTRLNYDLDFADRRITEMTRLVSAGETVPEGVMVRFQDQLQQALKLAAGMDDPKMAQQLEQIRLRAMVQLQWMNDLLAKKPSSAQPALLRVQERIQEQVRLAALGQTDPQNFRIQVQQRQQEGGNPGEQPSGPGNGPNGSGTMAPMFTPNPTGGSYGPGPENGQQGPAWQEATGTPQPGGNRYGPENGATGSGTMTPACTPNPTGGSYGPGNGDGSGMGGGQPTGMPGQNGPAKP